MEKYPQNGWFWTFLSFTHSAWVKISTFEKKLLISKKGPSCTFWILPPEEFFVKFFGKSPKIDSKINIKNKNKIDLFFSNGPKKSVGSVSHFGGGVRWRGHWHGQNAGGKWNKVAACALPCIGNARVSTLHCPKIRFKAAHPRMDLPGSKWHMCQKPWNVASTDWSDVCQGWLGVAVLWPSIISWQRLWEWRLGTTLKTGVLNALLTGVPECH